MKQNRKWINDNEFRLLKKNAILILNIRNREFKKKLLENFDFEQFKGRFSLFLNICSLITLFGYPGKKIKKKISKLLKIFNSKRFGTTKFKNITTKLTCGEIIRIRQFLIYFLADKDYSLYISAKNEIKQNKEDYIDLLFESLVIPNHAVSINAARLLNEIDSKKYKSENLYKILENLDIKYKNKLFKLLKFRNELPDKKEPWDLREEIILKLGALKFKPSLQYLKQFIEDPDPQCREALASSLGNFADEEAIECLYQLLVESNSNIRSIAKESLKKLLPGLYKNKSVIDILSSLDILKLIKLMEFSKFDSVIQHLWESLGFNSLIIKDFIKSNDRFLILTYIKESLSEGNQIKKKSLFLILKSRMPRILECLDEMLHDKSVKINKSYILKLTNKIQNEFKIEKENGFILYL